MRWHHEIVLAASTFHVAWSIGLILVILSHYFRIAESRPLRRRHVSFIALSYVILSLTTLRGLYIGAFWSPAPLWEMSLMALLTAYVLGDIALWNMFEFIKHANHPELDKDSL